MTDLASPAGFGKRRRGNDGPPPAAPAPVAPPRAPNRSHPNGVDLDGPDGHKIHARMMTYYRGELDRQRPNRALMAKDHRAYDHDQWDEADKIVVEERGQVPLVFNITATTINWVIGTERRSRKDFKVLPRRKERSQGASQKTALMKYLDDVNKASFMHSLAFSEAVKGGVGWMECGVEVGDDGEPIYDRHESWKNVLWDSTAVLPDIDDARYVIRTKWIDLDVAISIFPTRKAQLERAAVAIGEAGADNDMADRPMDEQEQLGLGGYSGGAQNEYGRERVRLIEVWFRDPVEATRITRGEFRGEIYDPQTPLPEHEEAITNNEARVMRRSMMMMHVAIMTEGDLLWHSPTPYRHNKFPLTPVFCYRRNDTNMPYGMVRGLRDINFDLNKRAAKALAIISSNKTIMEEGAVDDIDEYREEASRPDAVIVKRAGKHLEMNVDRNLADAHVNLMALDQQMIQAVGGVTDENLGRRTNATSGIAIGRRQEQGALATAEIFDNAAFARQVHGEKRLSVVEQYMHEEKQFRITNMRGVPEYVTINDGLPENDIARTRADYVITETEWRASVRQAQVEQLMGLLAEIAKVDPRAPLAMMDLVVDEMDITQREELVKRIRQFSGMSDPEQTEPTPEQIAAQEKAAQQEQMAIALQQATIADKAASAEQKKASAQRTLSQMLADRAGLAKLNVETIEAALNTAVEALAAEEMMPGAGATADSMLDEAGFQPQGAQPPPTNPQQPPAAPLPQGA